MSHVDPAKTVCLVGAGGLGVHLAMLLHKHCVLHVLDSDIVDRSNLPRQWLYQAQDIGRPKAAVVAERLGVTFGEAYVLGQQFPACDVLVDATDDVDVKFALNAQAVQRRVPYVTGGITGFNGYALAVTPSETPCLSCIFESPTSEMRRTCRDAGVLAPLPAMVGAVMASRVLALLAGQNVETLWSLDGTLGRAREVRFVRRRDCAVCGGLRAEQP